MGVRVCVGSSFQRPLIHHGGEALGSGRPPSTVVGAYAVLSLVTGVCSTACLRLGKAEIRALEVCNLQNRSPRNPFPPLGHKSQRLHNLQTEPSVRYHMFTCKPNNLHTNHQLGTTCSHADPATNTWHQLGAMCSHASLKITGEN